MIKINDKYKVLFHQPKQVRYYVITGGRGSGKSFALGIWACLKTFEKNTRILYTRYTLNSAHISIIPEFVEKIEMLNAESDFYLTKTEIKNTKLGTEILFRGIKTSSGNQTANLKSLHGVNIWILDEAEEMPDQATFDKIDLSIRTQDAQNIVILSLNPPEKEGKEHWIYKKFFEQRGVNGGYNGIVDDTCYIHTSYLDNLDNLSESFLKGAEQFKQIEPERYRRTYLGEWLEQPDGVLFPLHELSRYTQLPETTATLAYIDVADTGDDDHCVIIGKLNGKQIYIDDVLYTKLGTDRNVQLSADIINRNKPEYVRIESNMGGGMYRQLLTPLVNSSTQLLSVRNTTHKHTRITTLSGFIKTFCVFKQDYEINSDYGLFMKNLTNYLADGTSKHDDAPDALQGLVKFYRTMYGNIWDEFTVIGQD
jgi:phage terminase large subunit